MIARQDVQRLLRRTVGEHPVLSVFLDMSVNAENKRTHRLFLNKKRSEYEDAAENREAMGAAFDRMESWLGDEYDESNKGVALYAEVGGDWFEGLQFPIPVPHRADRSDLPVVGPLVELMESYHHHGVVLVSREQVRIMSLYLDLALYEMEVQGESKGEPHDVHRGFYSHRDYHDRREVEETKHWFREFAGEVERFVSRFRPDDLILLGTEENVQRFREFLPDSIRERVVHTGRAPVDATQAEVKERLRGFFAEQSRCEEEAVVSLLRERLARRHYAVGGFHDTLVELQEGKVDRLVLARNAERAGARCTKCGFYLDRDRESCPYCGGETHYGVDLVEAMIRIAEEKGVDVEFVSDEAMDDQHGVGALLRF